MAGWDRREFLRAGSLTIGGPLLVHLLQARAAASESLPATDSRGETAVIFVTLGGGASQFETWDPKPNAVAEYRGPFGSTATTLPGVRFCDALPKQAARMDRLAILRSVHHEQASHIAEHIVETGYDLQSSANARAGEMPSVGSVVSAVRGANPSTIPSYVSIPRANAYAGPHWLGAEHKFFAINDDPNAESFQVANLQLHSQLSLTRLEDRRNLARRLDSMKQVRDLAGAGGAIESFTRQAFDLVSGDAARIALDISRESESVRDSYGRHVFGQRLLLARRLVEAGVPFVTVRTADWDDHRDLAGRMQTRAPIFDTGLAALIDDLHQRQLHRNVLLVAMGEFGRTPRINSMGGRDHWPAVASVLFAGGRYRMGQVIGSSDEQGAKVTSAPYRPQNVLSMVYHHLGIDPAITFPDYAGRPRFVLEERGMIRELLG